jgi:hypothetical protein
VLGDQVGQIDLLGQCQQRHEPGVGEQIRVIEGDVDRRRGVGRLHLAGGFLNSTTDP